MTARPRICLIDDDELVLNTLALGLRDAGFEVVTASDAAAGFEIAQTQMVQGVITDMKMPGTSGAELIPELREHWPDLPIVAISGASIVDGRPIADVARALGANATMIKPFRVRSLADVMNQLLAARPAGSR